MCNAESQMIFCDLLPALRFFSSLLLLSFHITFFLSDSNCVSMLLRYRSGGILHSGAFSSIHDDDDAHVLNSII